MVLAVCTSSTAVVRVVRDCMTVMEMSWFIMSLVSAVLSMVWFWSWVIIKDSMSSKVS